MKIFYFTLKGHGNIYDENFFVLIINKDKIRPKTLVTKELVFLKDGPTTKGRFLQLGHDPFVPHGNFPRKSALATVDYVGKRLFFVPTPPTFLFVRVIFRVRIVSPNQARPYGSTSSQ